MCDIDQKVNKFNTDKTVDLAITCRISGKHITHSNEYGMYCDDECNLEKDKQAKKVVENLLDNLLG